MGRKPTRNQHLPPGMRARHRGNKIYYYYDLGGTPRREQPLGTDFIIAVQRWAEIEQRDAPKSAAPKFKDAVDMYLREVLPTKAPRTQSDNLGELTFLREFFDAEAPLDEIEPTHITSYLSWRHKKSVELYVKKSQKPPANAGHVRANRELALFSHIFNHARSRGLTKAANPCAGIKKNSESGRDVYVEDDLYQRVYAKADQPTKDAMDLAYLAGQRPQDTLNYDERDIREGFLLIDQGKTKKKLRMEIAGELKTVIDRIRSRKAGYKVVTTALVVNEKGQRMTLRALQLRFFAARDAAGIKPAEFQFRDLRAKAATDKTDLTGDIREAQKQLGHKSVTMTEVYVRKRRGEKVGPTR
ncbi:tyrosine-type recombinase/integrase [Paraburkholderia caribensis]|uniref:tyrosine-type recombinase/integrase n=1 Tax=Paraburkholderia caribensis TaxID=75105 RepID=UPI00285F80C9|nr:tyrosine-type recombinase/integrase [Paraburkholderia caribensis]MDR6381769.1 integrase [Paraburkholderia caribensis]